MSPAALLLLAVAFAFPNEQGTRLLATGDIARPETLHTALCSGNRQMTVQFERKQSEGTGGSGRQSPQNFANTAGAVFRITSGTVTADAACALTDESFSAGGTLMRLTRPRADARCSRADYPSFQADKGRPVVGCWPIATSGNIQVAVIEFSRRLTHALASLVVVDGDRRLYIDYPAEFKGPGDDLWRVDDGGEIHADRFDIVFLLKRGSTYVLAVDWKGAEGDALSVHTAEDSAQFKELVSDSWYRSPL